MDVRKLGELLPFGVYEDMPTEQLQAAFTAAPEHPIWKGVLQLATDTYRACDAVAKTPGIDTQSLDRAIGGQEALSALILECADRIRATRGEERGG